MRRIRELLRLKAAGGMSDRALAQQIGVARSTMAEYLERLEAAGLAWPLPDDVTDAVLEQRLFKRAGVRPGVRRHKEPDWAHLAREMRRPGVNLLILWEEYRQAEPGGYGDLLLVLAEFQRSKAGTPARIRNVDVNAAIPIPCRPVCRTTLVPRSPTWRKILS